MFAVTVAAQAKGQNDQADVGEPKPLLKEEMYCFLKNRNVCAGDDEKAGDYFIELLRRAHEGDEVDRSVAKTFIDALSRTGCLKNLICKSEHVSRFDFLNFDLKDVEISIDGTNLNTILMQQKYEFIKNRDQKNSTQNEQAGSYFIDLMRIKDGVDKRDSDVAEQYLAELSQAGHLRQLICKSVDVNGLHFLGLDLQNISIDRTILDSLLMKQKYEFIKNRSKKNSIENEQAGTYFIDLMKVSQRREAGDSQTALHYVTELSGAGCLRGLTVKESELLGFSLSGLDLQGAVSDVDPELKQKFEFIQRRDKKDANQNEQAGKYFIDLMMVSHSRALGDDNIASRYINELSQGGYLRDLICRGANLRECSFAGLDLQGVIFIGGSLEWANFKGVDLRNATLEAPFCHRAYFGEADLRGIKIKGEFSGGNNFVNAIIDDGTKKDLARILPNGTIVTMRLVN